MNHSAHVLHQLFISGEISAAEIVARTFARIKTHDSKIGAFLSLFEERAHQKAKILDEKRRNKQHLGKLAGVPIAVKDNIHVHGEITTCGSKFLTNYRAVFDSTVTRLLEEEDALLIGKTNMDEFAMGGSGTHSAFFPTHNPWNLSCYPGGSSSGSAAAVSARLCPVSLGSDTGGSVRQPGALTGTVGFKPTYGRVSRYGLVAFGSSLDQIGTFTYSVKDTALLAEVVGRHCEKDATSISLPPQHYLRDLERPLLEWKIGVPWSFLEGLSSEMRHLFDEALKVLEGLGMQIVPIDLSSFKHSISTYYILGSAEASTNLARFDGIRYGQRSKRANNLEEVYSLSRAEGFGFEVKKRIMLGTFVLSSGYQDAYYHKAQQVRALMIRQVREALTQCNVIVLPTTATPAGIIGGISDPLEEYLQDLYTTGANLAGLPAISVPAGFTHDKKPFGLQIMGGQMRDADVLTTAHAYEKATTFTQATPPLFSGDL